MNPTRTPGVMFVVRQSWPSLRWHVVPVEESQGKALLRREEKHVYFSSAQAHAIKRRLNRQRRRLRDNS